MRILITGGAGFVGGAPARYTLTDNARADDHIWWIIDMRRCQHDYRAWEYRHDLGGTLAEMIRRRERAAWDTARVRQR
jgi:nucleoside-diphosphate-sugar epimerase